MSDPARICTDCNLDGKQVPARFVVYEPSGLAKYACAKHMEPFDSKGLRWEPLSRLFERIRAMEAAHLLGSKQPTEEEMLTALTEAELRGEKEAFFHGTIRRCTECKRPIFGGPTLCEPCAVNGVLDWTS